MIAPDRRRSLAAAIARWSDRVVTRLAGGPIAEPTPVSPPPVSQPAVTPPERSPMREDALRLDMPDIGWLERHGERASYRYKLHESKRRKSLLNLDGHRQRIWAHNDKAAGRAFAESLGVAVPAVHVASLALDRIDWDALPDRFVLKPLNGAANRGVYLLARDGDRYREQLTGRSLALADVIAEAQRTVDAGQISERFSVEELLAPRAGLSGRVDHPDDFKVFCFWDRPAVVMQRRMGDSRDQSSWRFRLWNDRWEDLGPGKNADRIDPSLDRPDGADEILEIAAQLGRELAVPFARLDLYDTDRGVVFGEITPHPGPPERWSDELDELLGREWEIAEARLLVAGIPPNEVRP